MNDALTAFEIAVSNRGDGIRPEVSFGGHSEATLPGTERAAAPLPGKREVSK